MDIKFIGSGGSAKAIFFYITDYIAKHQLKSHVAYSLIETAIQKIDAIEKESNNILMHGKQLLQKCAHALISQQELSGQQVASYLLDYGDHYMSHTFKPLYWRAFEGYLNKQSPSPECYVQLPTSALSESSNHSNRLSQSTSPPDECINNHEENYTENNDDDEEVRVSVENNKLVIDSFQQADYVYRNSALDFLSLWDFCAQTKKIKSDPLQCRTSISNYDRTLLSSTSKTRPMFSFLNGHDQHSTHVLKIKHPLNRSIPTLIGSPPRVDREDQ